MHTFTQHPPSFCSSHSNSCIHALLTESESDPLLLSSESLVDDVLPDLLPLAFNLPDLSSEQDFQLAH